jgi:hypothetical protein
MELGSLSPSPATASLNKHLRDHLIMLPQPIYVVGREFRNPIRQGIIWHIKSHREYPGFCITVMAKTIYICEIILVTQSEQWEISQNPSSGTEFSASTTRV